MTTYSDKSNAVRAARKALGADAKADVDFTLAKTGKGWSWAEKRADTADKGSAPTNAPEAAEAAVEPPTGTLRRTRTPANPPRGPEAMARIQRDEDRAKFRGGGKGGAGAPGAPDTADKTDKAAVSPPPTENAAVEPLRAIAQEHGLRWPDVEAALQAAFDAGRGSKKERKARGGGKRDALIALLLRPEGASRAELLKASGWPAISVQAVARASKLTLRQEKDGGSFRYYGER